MQPRVFLDPGHNYSEYDTGATGYGVREQDVSFLIASKIKQQLEPFGVSVKMSRNTLRDNVGSGTVSSSLSARARMSNDWRADAFVSIHCNAGGGTGTETFSKCNDSSDALAKAIQESIVKATRLKDRGVKDGSHLAVLRKSNMPAVLVETAFIDNADDSAILASADGQEVFAKSIAQGICKFLDIEGGLTLSQYEELKNMIADLSNQVHNLNKPMIYNYIDDNMPDWARPTIQKLVDKGLLNGNDEGLNLNDDLIRMLVINDRAGIYD